MKSKIDLAINALNLWLLTVIVATLPEIRKIASRLNELRQVVPGFGFVSTGEHEPWPLRHRNANARPGVCGQLMRVYMDFIELYMDFYMFLIEFCMDFIWPVYDEKSHMPQEREGSKEHWTISRKNTRQVAP